MLKHNPPTLSQGFTLIELMIAMVILAILSALAAPSFSTMIGNYRVRTGAEGIISGLQLARAEAVRRNTNVSFTLNTGTGWTVAVVSPAATIQTRPSGESGTNLQVTSTNSQTTLTFTSTGSVSGYNATTNLSQVTVAPPSNVTSGDTLRINILAGGQIRMCNQSITVTNDPRRC